MAPRAFGTYRIRTLVGVSLTVAPPLGQYEKPQLINIGGNVMASQKLEFLKKIDPQFVILQKSEILAQAFAGSGGAIDVTAGLFLADPSSIALGQRLRHVLGSERGADRHAFVEGNGRRESEPGSQRRGEVTRIGKAWISSHHISAGTSSKMPRVHGWSGRADSTPPSGATSPTATCT